jgi:hypothetical protein
MFAIEMESKDDLQNDMLLMMLKRLLICTHVYKEQTELTTFDKTIDIVREYNYLVEAISKPNIK